MRVVLFSDDNTILSESVERLVNVIADSVGFVFVTFNSCNKNPNLLKFLRECVLHVEFRSNLSQMFSLLDPNSKVQASKLFITTHLSWCWLGQVNNVTRGDFK
jgi:hypothetical protein